jgi:hypothetical protein
MPVKKCSKTIILSILVVSLFVLIIGCLQQKPVDAEQNNTIQTPSVTPSKIDTFYSDIPIERIAHDMATLKEKGWDGISSHLGRTKTTTLLWYHIKKAHNIDTKMVFGNPNKLNTAIAIMESKGGESTFPKVTIKGDNYYIIDPMTPGIMDNFSYGLVFDDPASNYIAVSEFRLDKKDNEFITHWINDTGVDLTYTDFPYK